MQALWRVEGDSQQATYLWEKTGDTQLTAYTLHVWPRGNAYECTEQSLIHMWEKIQT